MYQITTGQLITLWTFGVFLVFVALLTVESEPFSGLLIPLVPGFVVFYTLGWKNAKKKQ